MDATAAVVVVADDAGSADDVGSADDAAAFVPVPFGVADTLAFFFLGVFACGFFPAGRFFDDFFSAPKCFFFAAASTLAISLISFSRGLFVVSKSLVISGRTEGICIAFACACA